VTHNPQHMIWATPPCRVLHCIETSGTEQWRTKSTLSYWPLEWAVCSYHYWQLDDGQEYASVIEDTPSTKRWLLMGDDLIFIQPHATLG
jgi:hypothetical protein